MNKSILIALAVTVLSGCSNMSVVGGSSVSANGVTYASQGTSFEEVHFELAMQMASHKGFNFCGIEDYEKYPSVKDNSCLQKIKHEFKVRKFSSFEQNIAQNFLENF
ncbi:MAG TPA: hypothetical protein DCL21_04075 [Alphaproteobacteria bacterium]|nr:hypothetical protein [Alphaproteobacteria bacterium]